jgi:hypothetical protein
MKMKRNLLVLLFLPAFASLAFSQQAQTGDTKTKEISSNLLEKVDLKFDLSGIPKPEDVGFDDPKSSWKLKYELRLSDEKTVRDLQLEMYANCKDGDAERQKCVSKANKKLSKKYKKVALFISEGEFQKTRLSSESSREIVIPINFTPEVTNIFNRAAASDDNPIFILQIKSKVAAKTSAKTKVRYKTSIRFAYPLKLKQKDGSFEFYNITTFGASVRVNKKDDGNFFYGIFKN